MTTTDSVRALKRANPASKKTEDTDQVGDRANFARTRPIRISNIVAENRIVADECYGKAECRQGSQPEASRKFRGSLAAQ